MPSDITRLESSARAFAPQFRAFTAADPSLCLKCFYDFEASIAPTAYEALGARCPEFYDALMHFVATDRALDLDIRVSISADLIIYASTRCLQCRALAGRYLMFSGTEETPFDTLFDLVCHILMRVLIPPPSTDDATLYRMVYKKLFRQGSWPSTPAQLLPRGAEQTIGRLVHLASIMQSAPIVLLTSMLQRYRKPVFEEILNEKHNSLLLRRVAGALGEAAKLASAALSAHFRNTGSSSASSPTPASDVAVVKAMEKYIAFPRLLNIIFHGIDSESHDLARFAYRYEATLYRAVIAVLANLAYPAAWDPELPNIAVYLYSRLEAADRHDPPWFIRQAALISKKRMEDVYLCLAYHLPLVLWRRGCSGPGCEKQVHDNPSGKAFAKCARCKAIHYCSKDCQRRDWNLKIGHPHKVICEILCELLAIVPASAIVKTKPSDTARAWREAAVPVERVRRVAVWMLGGEEKYLPTAFEELLNDTIGATPPPRTFNDCKTRDERLSFIERISNCRYPPGSRIVLVPVEGPTMGYIEGESDCTIVPLQTEEEQAFKEIELEEGKDYYGTFILKVVPP
ncbi:hypothetical protein EXIGLDRAFT_766798 [Exidia glandulosa HHB12029]|uniref:MYND-type domain-containing protein n=1 Tax=Exidia glandulosa HHB12029 TaxID=1314781 RepID=A0A165JFP7_EXIGL|nr:hypothetical protein EXIGLDRAFT_766798 [Exidia glandulosa HHB12029]